MAFNSMLGRVSKSLLPLAFNSVGSRRAFHSAIPAVLSFEGRNLGRDISRRNCLPFSTATAEVPDCDDKLIRVLDIEMQSVKKDVEGSIPKDFPFEIEDEPGERAILLTKKHEDEVVKVEVVGPAFFSKSDDDKKSKVADRLKLPLEVTIAKGDGLYLQFDISAYSDEVRIDTLQIRYPDEAVDSVAFCGPDFDDFDENLQKAFYKYLEARGIEPSLTSFLVEYMRNKENKENLLWLKNLKNFVEM